MNFFKCDDKIINVDNISFCEFNDDEVNIAFVGDGVEADWALTLYDEVATASRYSMKADAISKTQLEAEE